MKKKYTYQYRMRVAIEEYVLDEAERARAAERARVMGIVERLRTGTSMAWVNAVDLLAAIDADVPGEKETT